MSGSDKPTPQRFRVRPERVPGEAFYAPEATATREQMVVRQNPQAAMMR
jgi:hypothetical protein